MSCRDTVAQFKSVTKYYNDQVVIDDVSFDVKKNTITSLIGPNGAGKTTIAKLLLGIEVPSSGMIKKDSELKYSYVPQSLSINPCLPLNVETLIHYMSSANKHSRALIDQVLSFAQVGNLSNNPINQISGGQLKRVILAASLLKKPDLIVLDEPTQELDVNGQEDFYELLNNIRNELSVAIFIISHDLHAVMDRSDQVLCLNRHICCIGEPSHIMFGGRMVSLYKHHHNHFH